MSDGRLKNYGCISCNLSPNAQEKLSLMEMVGEAKGMKREKKKTALVAKWVHLLITMAVAVFPLVVGTHETFRSPRGLLKLQRLATLSPMTQLGCNGA